MPIPPKGYPLSSNLPAGVWAEVPLLSWSAQLSVVWFFFEVGSPAKAIEQYGLSQKKGDRAAQFFTGHTVSKAFAAVIDCSSPLVCCSAECNHLATICSLLESFLGPDTVFHSTLLHQQRVHKNNFSVKSAVPCLHRVHYN